MKKSNLITGIIHTVVGVAFLLVAMRTDSRLDSLLFGLGGGGIGSGVMMMYRYFYWNKPENEGRYEEKLELERIELKDELKVKLRDKSGRYAYICGLYIAVLSIILFYILEAFEIIGDSRMIILYLGGYCVFQIVIGVVIFHYLLKKYK